MCIRDRSVTLREERVAWEAYYRFYYHASPRDADSLEGAVLQVQSSEGAFSCPLPDTAFATYNNLVTLHLRTRTLSTRQPAWRTPLLVALRVTPVSYTHLDVYKRQATVSPITLKLSAVPSPSVT